MTTPATALPTISGGGTIVLNAQWDWTIGLGVDLTGWRFRMQLRGSDAPTDVDVLLDASTDNGRLVVDLSANTLRSAITVGDLAALSPGTLVADIVATSQAGETVNLCQSGPLSIAVREGVTR